MNWNGDEIFFILFFRQYKYISSYVISCYVVLDYTSFVKKYMEK